MGGLTFCSSRIYKDVFFLCHYYVFKKLFVILPQKKKKKDIIAVFGT